MNDEQKPESAEFRTREDQKTALAEALEDGMSRSASAEEAERHIAEVEARGAAEQRRKDAKRTDLVGYISEAALEYLTSSSPLTQANIYGSANPTWPIPLYTRPANVAALDARVKELEGAKGRKQEEARRYRNALANIVAKTGSHSVAHRIALEALAAIREGGEHG